MITEEQQAQIDNAVKARNAENAEILAIGKRFNCTEAAHQHIAASKSKHEFMDHVLKDVVKATPVTTTPDLGMSKKEKAQYSIVKAIREWVNGGSSASVSGLEKEASVGDGRRDQEEPGRVFHPARRGGEQHGGDERPGHRSHQGPRRSGPVDQDAQPDDLFARAGRSWARTF